MQDLINKLNGAANSAYREITVTATVETENFIKKNFDDEGFRDKNLNKWTPVKHKKTKKILTESGQMNDTLTVTGNGGIIQVNSPLPYTEVHNEGGKAGRGGSATIPQRQIIGESETLNNTFDQEIEKIINKHLK